MKLKRRELRVKKHRLKDLPKGRECYRLEKKIGGRKGYSQICLNAPDEDGQRFFSVARCTSFWKDKEDQVHRCYTDLDGFIDTRKRYAYISMQYTSPSDRGKRFGNVEYKKFEQFMKERMGVDIVRLLALQEADRYWRRHGFRSFKCWGDEGPYEPYKCAVGMNDDEEGGPKIKLLCGNRLEDFVGRTLDRYDRIDRIAPNALPKHKCPRRM